MVSNMKPSLDEDDSLAFHSPQETYRAYLPASGSASVSLPLPASPPPSFLPAPRLSSTHFNFLMERTSLSESEQLHLSLLPEPAVGLSQKIQTTHPRPSHQGGRTSYSSSPRASHIVNAGFGDSALDRLWRKFGNSDNPWAYQVKKWAVECPTHAAFVWLNKQGNEEGVLTYSDLAARVCEICNFLRTKLLLQPGDRVVLCYPPGLEFQLALYACLCAGVCAIPVYPPDPYRGLADLRRFLSICESASVSHVLTAKEYSRVPHLLRTMLQDKGWARLRWHTTTGLGSKFSSDLATHEFPALSPDVVAFLQYTSGSTGQPKGVMVTLGGLLHNCHLCCSSFGFPTCVDDPSIEDSVDDLPFEDYEDWFKSVRRPLHVRARGHDIRVFSWLPVYHDMGYQMSPLDFLRNPSLWLECVSRYECICTAGPNFAFELSVRKMPDSVYQTLNLSHVCGILCGAEPIRLQTVTRFLDKFCPKGLHPWAFRPAYGLAENTLIVAGPIAYASVPKFVCVDSTILQNEQRAVAIRDSSGAQLRPVHSNRFSPDDLGVATFVSCGHPKQEVDVRIVDPATNALVDQTHCGEIWIRSPSLARGYFGLAEETKEMFGNCLHLPDEAKNFAAGETLATSGGFFRTGDAGFFIEGELFVVGRLKDMLIIRGRNFFPQDIESEAETITALREGCSAAFAIEIGGEEKCGLAVEIRDTHLPKGLRAAVASYFHGERQEDKLEAMTKSIRSKVISSLGLEIAALWICQARSLPKTSSGKIRRSLARGLLLSQELPGKVLHGPTSALLAEIKQPILRTPALEHPTLFPHITPEGYHAAASTSSGGEKSIMVNEPSPPPATPASSSVHPISSPASVSKTVNANNEEDTERRKQVQEAIRKSALESLELKSIDESMYDHPFSELGVDSIRQLSFVESLSVALDRSLEPVVMYQYSTLRALENYLVDGSAEPHSLAMCSDSKLLGNRSMYIFGAACRFPGASRITLASPDSTDSYSPTVEGFWANLHNGIDSMVEVPLDRWNLDEYWSEPSENLVPGKMYTRGGGFIEDAEYFDHKAFRLNVPEVQQMDPQQRLALECCCDAIYHAGLTEAVVKHRQIGTYFGCCSMDWARIDGNATTTSDVSCAPSKTMSVYTSTAFAPSLIANRVSYVLGMTGPSVVLDTACSSSLVALDAAVHHLNDGKCEAALVGGVNMMLTAEVFSMLCKANMLSRDSRCKTWDVRADGYGRGEGVGCIFIAPDLNTVQNLIGTDSEPVSSSISLYAIRYASQKPSTPLAIIKGIAVNHGGMAAGLTAPSIKAHQEVMEAALMRAGVLPRNIEFLEAHGTGTSLGDPIELLAVKTVYGRGRAFDFPLVVGSVKTNIGHLEGAAGIAGVIKAIGVLVQGRVPMNIHLKELNPLLRTEGFPVVFPTESYPLSEKSGDRSSTYAAVSSFGFGGTNSHAILEAYNQSPASSDPQSMPKQRKWQREAFSWRNRLPPMVGSCEHSTSDDFIMLTHLRTDVTKLLAEHVVMEVPVMPGAALLELIKEAYHEFCFNQSGQASKGCMTVESLEIERPIVLSEVLHEGPPSKSPPLSIRVTINRDTGDFSVLAMHKHEGLSSRVKNMVGRLVQGQSDKPASQIMYSFEDLKAEIATGFEMPIDTFYDHVKAVGLSLGPRFKTVKQIWRGPVSDAENAVPPLVARLGHAFKDERCPAMERSFYLHPAILDGIMQLAALAVASTRKSTEQPVFFVPVRMDNVSLGSFEVSDELFCKASILKFNERGGVVQVILFSAATNSVVAFIDRLQMAQVNFSIPVEIPKELLWTSDYVELPSSEVVSETSQLPWGEKGTWLIVQTGSEAFPQVPVPSSIKTVNWTWTDVAPKLMDDKENIELYTNAIVLIDSILDAASAWGVVGALAKIAQDHKSLLKHGSRVILMTVGDRENLGFKSVQALRRSADFEWMAHRVPLPLFCVHLQSCQCLKSDAEWAQLFTHFSQGELEVSISSDKTEAPRLMPLEPTHNVMGSLVELTVDPTSLGLKLRPFSSAARRFPSTGEVEVSVRCFAFDSVSNPAAAEDRKAAIFYSGIISRLPPSGLTNGNLKVGDRVVGAWHVPRKGGITLKSMACVPADSVIEKFLEDIAFEAAVVDSLVGLPSSEEVTRTFKMVDVHDNERLQGCIVSDNKDLLVVKFPSVIDTTEETTPALAKTDDARSDPHRDTVVITGGLGALGLRIAEWLIGEGVRNIVLLSRKGSVRSQLAATSPEWNSLMSAMSHVNVKCMACDVSDPSSTLKTFERICSDELLRVVGIIHAAGSLRDVQMSDMTEKDMEEVFKAKVAGVYNLNDVCSKFQLEQSLRFFVAFSSIASTIGNLNQTNYAMANSLVESAMESRREKGLVGQSIAWGPWTESGMAKGLESAYTSLGLKGISPDLGLRVLSDFLKKPQTSVICMPLLDPHIFMQNRPRKWNYYEAINTRAQAMNGGSTQVLPEKLANMSDSELFDFVRITVMNAAMKITSDDSVKSIDDIPMDVPLADTGVDSLGAVEFRDEISRQLGMALPVSALFDYPALDGLIEFIFKEAKQKKDSGGPPIVGSKTRQALFAAPGPGSRASDGYAVVGIASRLPRSPSPQAFWTMLLNKTDCVIEVPLERFNLDNFYSPDADKPGCAYTRAGAFMNDVDLFDNLFFGITDAEAKLMDPQQRLMLETAYDAVVDAGLDTKSIRTHYKDIAVYIGCCNFDWHYMDANNNPAGGSPFSCTGGSMSLVSNRISYCLGLEGPSMTVDTACSSSLVALDAGREKLDSGVCSGLIVGGINLMLSPQLFIGFCKTRLLSPDCACRTFDARANGYVRGEGAAAFLLLPAKSVRRANVVEERVYATIKGSATNHVGRGSALTAPKGPLQAACIGEALFRARKVAGDVIFLESHGTGTEIGDPIEAGAIKSTYADRGVANVPLVLGALKSNIGHLEGAAGVAGLLKTILVLHKREIPPNVHFEKLSPHIDFSGCNFIVPGDSSIKMSSEDLGCHVSDRICGAVSSFGFGGANAHVIIESNPMSETLMKNRPTESRRRALFFTGQGSQKLNMGKQLMDVSSVFANTFLALDASYRGFIGSDIFRATIPIASSDLSLPPSVLDCVYGSPASLEGNEKDVSLLDSNAVVSQVAIVMLQLALIAHLKLEPDSIVAILGHSLGELSSLAALDILSPFTVLELVILRAALIQTVCLRPHQAMVACMLSREAATAKILELGLSQEVAVAAENGAKRIVLSGDETSIMQLCEALGVEGARKLAISRAYHSPFMRDAESRWRSVLKTVYVPLMEETTSKTKFYSTVSGLSTPLADLCTAEYWVKHLINPVEFRSAVELFVEETTGSIDDIVEIGPSGVLLGMATHIVPSIKSKFRCHQLDSDPVLDGVSGHRTIKAHKWNRRRHPWTEHVCHPLVGHGQKLFDGNVEFKVWLRVDACNFFREHVVANKALFPAAGFIDMISVQIAQMNSKRWTNAITTIERMDFLQPCLIPPKSVDRATKFHGQVQLVVTYQSDGTFEIRLVSDDEGDALQVVTGKVQLRQGVAEQSPPSTPSSPRSDFPESGDGLNAVKQRVAASAALSATSSTMVDLGFAHIAHGEGRWSKSDLFEKMAEESEKHLGSLYERFAKKGLKYGPRFRTLRQLVCSDTDAIAFCKMSTPIDPCLAHPEDLLLEDPNDEALDKSFRWHPGMLDAAFQAMAPLFRTSDGVYIPSAAKHVCLKGVAPDELAAGLWMHSKVQAKDESSISMSICIYSSINDEKIGQIMDMRFRRLILTPSYSLPQNIFWAEQYVPVEPDNLALDAENARPTNDTEAITETTDATVRLDHKAPPAKRILIEEISPTLVFSETGEVTEDLGLPNSETVTLETLPSRIGFYNFLLTADLLPLKPHPERAASLYVSVVKMLQCCLANLEKIHHLTIAIFGYAEFGVVAFVKAVNLEISNQRKIRVVAAEITKMPSNGLAPISRQLVEKILTVPKFDRETLLRYINGSWCYNRLAKETHFTLCGPIETWLGKRGTLQNLRVRPASSEQRMEPGMFEIEVRVLAVGLNFRDVLNVLGMYPGDPGLPGADFAGIVVRVGSHQKRFACGDAVFGIGPGSLRSFVTTAAELAGRLPIGWTFEEACALPVAQITVEYAFTDVAKLDPTIPIIPGLEFEQSGFLGLQGRKPRILIHAGSGGVGLFAVQYCSRIGAEVFCTVGADFKKEYLKSLGIRYITSSRDPIKFKEDMAMWLGESGKVDIVLNSLSGNYIPFSLYYLAENGFFLELGKLKTWTNQQMAELRPDVQYHQIAVDHMVERSPQWFASQLDRCSDLCTQGIVKQIRLEPFPMSDLQAGLRHLQGAKHIGKVVITIPSLVDVASRDNARHEIDLNGTVIVTGGLGGVGLVVIRWLICEVGLRRIVVLSRSATEPKRLRDYGPQEEPTDASRVWDEIQQFPHAAVSLIKCDVSQVEEVEQVLADFLSDEAEHGTRVIGIIHSAGVLADVSIRGMNELAISTVMAPKIAGFLSLDSALRKLNMNDDLKFFVVFSSMSALLGNFNQTNYAAANAIMDELVLKRREAGLKCQSIRWGPWVQQGMAKNLGKLLHKIGMKGLTNDLGVRVLESLILQPHVPILGVESIKWKQYLSQYGESHIPGFFVDVAGDTNLTAARDKLNKDLLLMSPDVLREHVFSVVLTTAMQVTGRKAEDGLDVDQPITEAGIDSLAAVEFGNELSQKLGVKLSATTLFDYPTLNGIAGHIHQKIVGTILARGTAAADLTLAMIESDEGLLMLPDQSPLDERPVSKLTATKTNALAILGASCRFPKRSWNLDEFWKMMCEKMDCVSYIPEARFDVAQIFDLNPLQGNRCYVREAACMDDVDLFDPAFFRIALAEVECMDPQQRIFLEVAYECFLDAKMDRHYVLGKSIACYVGCCNFDWHCTEATSRCESTHSSTGSAASIIANRLSYFLGLIGPSLVVDTACSSSLVALDAAFNKMATDDTLEGALIGGVNVIAAPHAFVAFCKTKMLSPDGRCKTFDASANGYGRGEGCGAVLLVPQRLAKHKRVHAVVRGSAVNHDGRSASLTAPNGRAQRAVLANALARSGVTPHDVVYVEAHGTGTAMGDPIEAGAIRGIYLDGPRPDSSDTAVPLIIGSVKTNIGHLEGAAGMAGLIKAVLVLKNRAVPPMVHFKKLNPGIQFEGVKVAIPTGMMDLEIVTGRLGRAKPRFCAAVSSFGFGGANANVIIEEASQRQAEWTSTVADEPADHTGGIVFLFTGQGTQYHQMAKELYEEESIFTATVDRLLNSIGEVGATVRRVWLEEAEPDALLNDTRYAQVAIFVLQVGILRLLESRGVKPTHVLGHSLGEFAAAVSVGVISEEDGVCIVRERAEAMAAVDSCADPVMCAMRVTEDQALEAIRHTMGTNKVATVALAAVNGKQSIVLSGPKADVFLVVSNLGESLDNVKFLNVSQAFHSPQMESAIPRISHALKHVRMLPIDSSNNVSFISTVTGDKVSELELTDPEYWTQQILSPVRFSDAILTAVRLGGTVFVEIGPRPTLINLGRLALATDDRAAAQWISSIVPNISSRTTMDAVVRLVNGDGQHAWNHTRFPWAPCSVTDIDVPSTRHEIVSTSSSIITRESQEDRQSSALLVHKAITEAAAHSFQGVVIDFNAPMSEVLLAVDSLTAVEFREQLCDKLEMDIPVTVLFDHPNFQEVEDFLVSKLLGRGQKLKETSLGDKPTPHNVIAIVGLSCAFPRDIRTPDNLWNALVDGGKSSFIQIPPERYNFWLNYCPKINETSSTFTYSNVAAIMNDDIVTSFPVGFFKANPAEIELADPQQRISLKVGYEAFARAGYTLASLAGTKTGVYVGCSDNEWPLISASRPTEPPKANSVEGTSTWRFTGSAACMLANRISHVLKLRGPSMTIDTGCSSFANALTMGMDSLALERSNIALVVGISLILTPMTTIGFSQMRYLSSQSRVASFDMSAAGTLRGEGCGAFALKRHTECLHDGSKVYGCIRGAAISSNGGGSSLTSFSTQAQELVIRSAVRNSGIAFSDVDFIEAHGTGIPLSDAVEFSALKSVFGSGQRKVYISTIHPNLGHSNGALGAAQLMKALLITRHKTVPRILNFVKPHTFLDMRNTNLEFAHTDERLLVGERPVTGLLNSYGMGGANASIIVAGVKSDNVLEQAWGELRDEVYLGASTHSFPWTPPDALLAAAHLSQSMATPEADVASFRRKAAALESHPDTAPRRMQWRCVMDSHSVLREYRILIVLDKLGFTRTAEAVATRLLEKRPNSFVTLLTDAQLKLSEETRWIHSTLAKDTRVSVAVANHLEGKHFESVFVLPMDDVFGNSYNDARRYFRQIVLVLPQIIEAHELQLISTAYVDPKQFFVNQEQHCRLQPLNWCEIKRFYPTQLFGGVWLRAVLECCLSELSKSHRLTVHRCGLLLDEIEIGKYFGSGLETAIRCGKVAAGRGALATTVAKLTESMVWYDSSMWTSRKFRGVEIVNVVADSLFTPEDFRRDLAPMGLAPEIASLSEAFADEDTQMEAPTAELSALFHRLVTPLLHPISAIPFKVERASNHPLLSTPSETRLCVKPNMISMGEILGPQTLSAQGIIKFLRSASCLPESLEVSSMTLDILETLCEKANSAELSTGGALMLKASLCHAVQNLELASKVKYLELPDFELVENPVFVVGLDRFVNSLVAQILTSDKENFTSLSFGESMTPFGLLGDLQWVDHEDLYATFIRMASRQSDFPRKFINNSIEALRETVGPLFSSLFPQNADDLWEDTLLLELCGLSPSYMMKFQLDCGGLLARHLKMAYPLHQALLSVCAWRRSFEGGPWRGAAMDSKTLVLTSPYHLLGLDSLLRTYPNAKIIFVAAGLKSSASFSSKLAEQFQSRTRLTFAQSAIHSLQVEMMEKSLDVAEHLLEKMPRSQLFVLDKETMMKRTIECVVSLRDFVGVSTPPPRSTYSMIYSTLMDQLLPHNLPLADLGKLAITSVLVKSACDACLPKLLRSPLARRPAKSRNEWQAALAVFAQKGIKSGEAAALSEWIPINSYSEDIDPRMAYTELLRDSVLKLYEVSVCVENTNRDCIVVTGATGFIGRYILNELLKRQHTSLHGYSIVCLVRPDKTKSGLDRLLEAFALSGLPEADFSPVEIFEADLQKDYMGLDRANYTELARRVHSFYHCAGQVEMICDFEEVCDSNVGATFEVVKFLIHAGHPNLLYVSSQAVFPTGVAEVLHLDLYQESEIPTRMLDIPEYRTKGNGYAWAKQMAEVLCQEMSQRFSIPLAIFRLPHICFAHTPTAENPGDPVPEIMRLCFESGTLSDNLVDLMDTVAAEDVAANLVKISLHPDALCVHEAGKNSTGNTYHLCRGNHPSALSTSEDAKAITRSLGLAVEFVEADDFFKRLRSLNIPSDALDAFEFASDWLRSPTQTRVGLDRLRMMSAVDPLPNTHRLGLSLTWKSSAEVWGAAARYCLNSGALTNNARVCAFDGADIIESCHSVIRERTHTPTSVGRAIQQKFLGPRRTRTLLNDEDWFLQPLEIFRKSIAHRTDLNPLGRVFARRMVHQWYLNLLLLQEVEAAHPTLLDVPIVKDPVFIVGLNRSGTTFLYHALAQNRKFFRAPILAELMMPYGAEGTFRIPEKPVPCTQSFDGDPRLEECRFQMDATSIPNWELIHQSKPDLPEEDYILFDGAGRSLSFPIAYDVPEYLDWLTMNNYANLRDGYQMHSRVLKHLQLQRETPRWLIKGPWHMLTMETLIEHYPGAKIIYIQRDYAQTTESWLNLVLGFRSHLSTQTDHSQWARAELDREVLMVRRFEEFRRTFTASPVHDVDFSKMIENPIKAIADIYKFLGCEKDFTREERCELEGYFSKDKNWRQHSELKMNKKPLEYFGLNAQEVYDRFINQ